MRFPFSNSRPNRPSGTDLDGRLRLLEDEAAILRVMNLYCHAIDYGPPELWADCFTEDGIYVGKVKGRTRQTIGREALIAYAAAHEVAPVRYVKHMLWAPVIDIDGDHAVATGMFAVLNNSADAPFVEVYGRYEDELTRQVDGSWRLKKRTSNVEATAASFQPTPIQETHR